MRRSGVSECFLVTLKTAWVTTYAVAVAVFFLVSLFTESGTARTPYAPQMQNVQGIHVRILDVIVVFLCGTILTKVVTVRCNHTLSAGKRYFLVYQKDHCEKEIIEEML